MKQAVVQTTIPGSTGNQSITDSVFGADQPLAIFASTNATANNTSTAGGALVLGATDGTSQFVVGIGMSDAANPTTVGDRIRTDKCAGVPTIGNSADFTAEANFNAFVTNGVEVNWTDAGASELMQSLLISGVPYSVKTTNLNGTTPVSVTHSLGVTPSVIIVITNTAGSTGGNSGGARMSVGWYVPATSEYCTHFYYSNPGVAGTQNVDYPSSTWVAAQYNGGTEAWTATIQNVGSSTFEIVANAATTDLIGIICIGGVSAKAGWADGRTTTGSTDLASGLAFTPSVMLLLPTRRTTIDSTSTADAAGMIGLGMAVNNAGNTQQGSAGASSDDNATPSDENSQTSNTQALRILSIAGALLVGATATWSAGAAGLNYATVDGTAYKIGYLLLGTQSGILRQMMMHH